MGPPAHLEYEVDSPTEPRFLIFPGLSANQDVRISWCDDSGRWRRLLHVFWLRSAPSDNGAVIDLGRLTNWQWKEHQRIRLEMFDPGEIALNGPPCLVR